MGTTCLNRKLFFLNISIMFFFISINKYIFNHIFTVYFYAIFFIFFRGYYNAGPIHIIKYFFKQNAGLSTCGDLGFWHFPESVSIRI